MHLSQLSQTKKSVSRGIGEIEQFTLDQVLNFYPDAQSGLHIKHLGKNIYMNYMRLCEGAGNVKPINEKFESPQTRVSIILKPHHDTRGYWGYDGFLRTYRKRGKQLCWKCMQEHVVRHVRTFPECQTRKAKYHPRGYDITLLTRSLISFQLVSCILRN